MKTLYDVELTSDDTNDNDISEIIEDILSTKGLIILVCDSICKKYSPWIFSCHINECSF